MTLDVSRNDLNCFTSLHRSEGLFSNLRTVDLPQIVRRFRTRRGISLIEVILALGLTALVTGLIGGLIQLYQGNMDIAKDNVRQARVARAVLTMIADDIRGVLRPMQFDDQATLEEFLAGSISTGSGSGISLGGSQGGGGQSGGPGTPGTGNDGTGNPGAGGNNTENNGQASGAAGAASGSANRNTGGNNQGGGSNGSSTGSSGGTGGSSSSGANASSTNLPSTDGSLSETTTTNLPVGIYGTSSSIEIDVSRPPRPDEYFGDLNNPLSGKVGDIASDTKTVTYYIQSPGLNGVQDPLTTAATSNTSGSVANSLTQGGGLVRRSLDRAVTRHAYEKGNTQQLQRTGQLVAPEIVSMSFAYFDGQQWLQEWDSSSQGMPWAIQITVAMQHSKAAREAPISPGASMQNLQSLTRGQSGIETYTMMAIVPGANLLKTPAETSSTSTDGATSSLGF